MTKGGTNVWQTLAAAIGATGTSGHIDRLIDAIAAQTPHDLVTVTRYSVSARPQFVKHRRFSDEMVERYLNNYYVYDPFYAHWRQKRSSGIFPLRRLTNAELKRGKYIAEFLAQSRICDELGILLEDGGDWCLAIFLDRTERLFRQSEITALEERFPIFVSLHEADRRTRGHADSEHAPGGSPLREPILPETLWPRLSDRERQLVQLILAGHPSATIAEQLGIAAGTVKNHRRRIYSKLDITTERELFLQFFQHQAI